MSWKLLSCYNDTLNHALAHVSFFFRWSLYKRLIEIDWEKQWKDRTGRILEKSGKIDFCSFSSFKGKASKRKNVLDEAYGQQGFLADSRDLVKACEDVSPPCFSSISYAIDWDLLVSDQTVICFVFPFSCLGPQTCATHLELETHLKTWTAPSNLFKNTKKSGKTFKHTTTGTDQKLPQKHILILFKWITYVLIYCELNSLI